MEIDVQLTQADWVKLNRFIQRKKQKERKSVIGGFGGNLVLWFLLTMVFVVLYRTIDKLHWPTAVFVSAVFLLVIAQFLWDITRLQKALMPSTEGTFVGNHHFTFDETGIHSQGHGYRCFYE